MGQDPYLNLTTSSREYTKILTSGFQCLISIISDHLQKNKVNSVLTYNSFTRYTRTAVFHRKQTNSYMYKSFQKGGELPQNNNIGVPSTNPFQHKYNLVQILC